MKVVVSTRVDKDIDELLETASRILNVSKSDLLRLIISSYAKQVLTVLISLAMKENKKILKCLEMEK